jgi:hypothetical protein
MSPVPNDEFCDENDGAALLDDVRTFMARFVAFPSPCALDAVTLWTAHSHLMKGGDNTPRLALLSPEPGSGKTRTLEVMELLVPDPMLVLSASSPTIFRSLKKGQRVLLFDEVDTIFRKKGKDDPAEDLRALLNAGHRRGATIPRCVGPTHDVTEFPVFAAAALAGLGDLPETILTRSIPIRMRRRLASERVEQFRRRLHEQEGTLLRDALAYWCAAVSDEVGNAWPVMPDGVTDRLADCWEPLLSVADAAGGHWPETARVACLELVKVSESREASLNVKLLSDLRIVFGVSDALSTADILEALCDIEESPWNDLKGKALDARGLAWRLRQYGISSVKVKVDNKALQGYRREHLWDTFARYLSPTPESPEPPEPVEPPRSEAQSEVPFANEVPEPENEVEPNSPPVTRDVPEVPEVPLPQPQGGLIPTLDDEPPPGDEMFYDPEEPQSDPSLVPTADAPCPVCGAPPPRRTTSGDIACDHQIDAGLVSS